MTDQEFRERVLTDLTKLKTDVQWLKDAHKTNEKNAAKAWTHELARLVGALLAGIGGGYMGGGGH